MKRSSFLLKRILLTGLMGCGLTVSAQEILVQPYIQPGNASTLIKEQKVLIWHTDSVPATFTVEFAPGNSLADAKKIETVKVSFAQLKLRGQTTLLYRATLSGLKFDTDYCYRVRMGGKEISTAVFASRTKKKSTRFAVFGDCGTGSAEQKAIAYQVSLQKPQFVLIPGDIVYNKGIVLEYHARFFPVYLDAGAAKDKGAPLMKTVPFYMLLGNHDIYGADLDKNPGGLAYFYFSDLPVNAPIPQSGLQATGKPETVKAFVKVTGGRYPGTANYSFDYGNVHITCLDANYYVNPLDPGMVEWMKNDILSSTADWKIVTFHEPGFNSSKTHDEFQPMRLLSPVLEALGVDMVFNGHVHNYQRTMPLKFAPKVNEKGDQYVISLDGRVDGKFTLDQKFDGVTQTKPDGIIYIVSGGGGAALYDRDISNKPEQWKHEPPENWVPFTVKLISDTHSFTMIETEGKKLTLRQINLEGTEIDKIKVTK